MKKVHFKHLLLFAFLILSKSMLAQNPAPILVTSQSINISGVLTVGSWLQDHPKEEYPDYPKLFYAFSAGDEIILDFSTENKKGTQLIEVIEYDSKSKIYSNHNVQQLNGLKIQIPRTGVYQFEFATNHAFDRQCRIELKRVPALGTTNFNHMVSWKTVQDTSFIVTETVKKENVTYETVSLQPPNEHFINGGLNASFAGGKSRITFPITLPENTVEWYYSFAATRNKEAIQSTKNQMRLLSDLSKFTGVGLLTVGLDMLSNPPGADYCDVYLLTNNSYQNFESKLDTKWQYYPEASRSNFMSGVVKVKNCCKTGTYYIGIKNPSSSYGIAVMIEVVAIVEKYNMEKVKIKTPATFKEIRIPVMQN